VAAAQHKAEDEAHVAVARTLALRMAMWLLLIPLVWSMGPRSTTLGVAVVSAILFSFTVSWWGQKQRALSSWGVGLVIATSALPLYCLTLIFGSFVLVPALTSTLMVLASGHVRPAARTPVIVFGVLLVLVPFALGEWGVLEASYLFTGDEVVIVSRAVHFPPGVTKAVLVVTTLSTLVLPSILAGGIRDRLALAERRLLMTAWHLDRLGKLAPAPERAASQASGGPSRPAQTAPGTVG
jgi:hypothetical protein